MNSIPDIHFDSMAKLETSYWWHQSRLAWGQKIIVKYLADPNTLDVLDYGCGTGGFLYQLSKKMKFRSCLGVDVAEGAIEKALNRSSNYSQIKKNDFNAVSGMDLIFLMDALEHIENDEAFLRNIFGKMKIGAHLLISVPAFSCLFSSWDKALGHYRRYKKNNLGQVIKVTGGSVIYMDYAFSYLFPAVALKRIIGQAKYDKNNCEFPFVPSFLSSILLKLNAFEVASAEVFSIPFGSSLFCLAKKQASK
jgi:SAM-dependent methyltransferase